jgi:hypothetical protein
VSPLQAFAVVAAATSFTVAIVFALKKVINGWFDLFIAAVGFMILSFSTPLERIQQVRDVSPAMYFFSNVLILFIFPLLFMSVRRTLGSPLRLKDWPYAALFALSLSMLAFESWGMDPDLGQSAIVHGAGARGMAGYTPPRFLAFLGHSDFPPRIRGGEEGCRPGDQDPVMDRCL